MINWISLKIIIGNYVKLKNRVNGFIVRIFWYFFSLLLYKFKQSWIIFSVWPWNSKNLIRVIFMYCSRFWFVEKKHENEKTWYTVNCHSFDFFKKDFLFLNSDKKNSRLDPYIFKMPKMPARAFSNTKWGWNGWFNTEFNKKYMSKFGRLETMLNHVVLK